VQGVGLREVVGKWLLGHATTSKMRPGR
jgi:hypothetical protein